jgi:hypothetical protein
MFAEGDVYFGTFGMLVYKNGDEWFLPLLIMKDNKKIRKIFSIGRDFVRLAEGEHFCFRAPIQFDPLESDFEKS